MRKVDWSQFDDWNKTLYNKADGISRNLISKGNSELILSFKNWNKKVEAFEAALNSIPDDDRKQKRADYCIHFDGQKFGTSKQNNPDFGARVFPCSISFRDVNFGNKEVSFRGAKFVVGDVDFTNTRFVAGDVTFRYATFGEGTIHFNDAKVENGNLILKPIYLSPNTKINGINMYIGGSLYLRANFPKYVNFCGLKVAKSANISGSEFDICPNFLDSKFGRPPEVAYMKVPEPCMERKKVFSFFKTCPDAVAAAKYRKLKSMALAANDHEKDGEFFAYEMMAKRGVEITGFWELLANSFYYHVSYYGQSWTRPLVGVFISWFVFTFIYLNSVAMILKAGSLNFSAIYSALNSFPFLSSLHRLTLKPQDYEGSLEKTLDTLAKHDGVVDTILNWAMFQQFIGIVLLFFLLLGLRNRFRLK